MLWVIIWLLVVIGFTVYTIRDRWSDWGDVAMAFFGSFMAGFAIVMMVTLFSSAICDEVCDKTWYTSSDVEIHALQDNITTEGRFFLGSGQVDGNLKYFYVEDTEFGYTVRDVDADNTYIKNTDGKCHLETQTYEFDNWFVRLIAAPMGERRIFYIPEGSILQNYNIDLQ
jgi:hypothetical protein